MCVLLGRAQLHGEARTKFIGRNQGGTWAKKRDESQKGDETSEGGKR